ncbi:MAG: glyceraldehyde 3-phosphate dehydrogenase NAD-binding domain-containing protein [Pseudomonadales bacterium]|jgi:glyceraldehyde 3-phosphate dehydrogenase
MTERLKIGLMGFGHIGRQIYQLALDSDQFEIVVISDIGHPEILGHLLNKTLGDRQVSLEKNHLICGHHRTRLMTADRPTEIPWDVFGADMVIDATGKFRSTEELKPHLHNGARRVILSTLPVGEIDRVVLRGVNDQDALASDVIVSAGSASTTATALALKIIGDAYPIAHATMTSVHAYTSDQSLQDYAGADYRRSRSGAENIIPNLTPALDWVQRIMPNIRGRMTGYALNVPVQTGSMLDITVSLESPTTDISAITDLFVQAAIDMPLLIETTSDPIVSSDVKGSTQSLLVDLQGCMLAGKNMFKLLAWHETLGHAKRILETATLYRGLETTHAGSTREVS